MNWQAISFDWNHVRAFLVTAEEGSLSAAARALGQTQPTLSRQVAALEETLDLTLFERAGRAMTLTDTGKELVSHVRTMADAATQFSLVASGQSQNINGKVVITATTALATYYLAPIVRKIYEAAPQITIDIVTSNQIQDLTLREADIAIRHTRPEQPDLIGKLLGETQAHLYASTSYLRQFGSIRSLKDLETANFLGFDQNEHLIASFAQHGLNINLDSFRFNTPAGTVMRQLVSEGLGVGILTDDIGLSDPTLKPILPDKISFPVPVWLVTHRELRTSRRIRLVYDIIAEELAQTTFM